MKTKRFLALALLSLASAASWSQSIGIASGAETGTNWPMVEDVIKVCSRPGAEIRNRVTAGGQENLDLIYTDKTTQYGIVPEDVLVYEQGNDPKKMEKIVQIFPFFTTEIHLVVTDKSPIRTVADLAGKRVVDGPDGSASWITTQVVKNLMGMQWSGMKLSQKDGMAALLAGQADAMFITAGKPITIISNTKGIRLVPIESTKLDSFKYYTKTRIDKGSYAFLPGSVNTYKVNNVLATYAFKNQYQKEIGDLVTCITRNVEKMQTTAGFHPKWRDVNPLDIESVSWPAHPAALAAIKREAKRK